MTPLARELCREIATGGALRFDRYMERALFDARHGYYAADRARIGRDGDFHTSVSVGATFGRVLAAQCAEVWELLGRPRRFDIVEHGANDGRLAADVLAALKTDHPACLDAAVFTLVEPFPHLRARQAETLAQFAGHIEWSPALEQPFTGVHLSNEYVDALPVRLFVRAENGWLERHVTVRDGSLNFDDLPAADIPDTLPGEVPVGYLAEIRPGAAEWIRDIASHLVRGVALVIDYGFPRDVLHAPWRTAGTLSCYRANRRDDDPLESPGTKDITAHVDFTALAETAIGAGLRLAGFTDQYHFLVGAGSGLLLDLERQPPSPARDATLREIKTLLHPETMGTQFKYLALAREFDAPLSGFRHARPAAATLGLA